MAWQCRRRGSKKKQRGQKGQKEPFAPFVFLASLDHLIKPFATHLCLAAYKRAGRLWQPEESQLRFCRTVPRPGVPDLDAIDHPVTSAKIDHPCFAAGLDPASDRNLFIRAIAVMDHNAIELDRSAFDANLERAEPPV